MGRTIWTVRELCEEMDATITEGAGYLVVTREEIASVLPELLGVIRHYVIFHPLKDGEWCERLTAKWKPPVKQKAKPKKARK